MTRRRASHHHAPGRTLRHDARHRSRARLQSRESLPLRALRSPSSKRSRISRVARTRPTMSRCSSSATELLLLLSPQTPTRHCPLRLHPRPPPPLHPHATLLLLSPQPPRTKHEALPGNCLLAHSLSRGHEG